MHEICDQTPCDLLNNTQGRGRTPREKRGEILDFFLAHVGPGSMTERLWLHPAEVPFSTVAFRETSLAGGLLVPGGVLTAMPIVVPHVSGSATGCR